MTGSSTGRRHLGGAPCRRASPDARSLLLASLALDLIGSTMLVVLALRVSSASRMQLGGTAFVAATGVGTAAPLLIRATRGSSDARTRAASITVVVGLVWNTAGTLVLERRARASDHRSPSMARALLVAGDALSIVYLGALRRLDRPGGRERPHRPREDP